MSRSKYLGLLLTVGTLVIGGVVALAQVTPVPKVVNVGPTDLFQDVVGGAPKAGNVYATAAQINGVQGYHNFGTISGDPGYTVPNGVTNLFAHASGTITTVTITTEPNPADGKRECWYLDQITTNLTWTANTGQTIDSSAHVAGAQYISNCITYSAATATWYTSN